MVGDRVVPMMPMPGMAPGPMPPGWPPARPAAAPGAPMPPAAAAAAAPPPSRMLFPAAASVEVTPHHTAYLMGSFIYPTVYRYHSSQYRIP